MYPQFYPYNMQQNQFQPMNQMQNAFIVRQVTSIDEAKAYIVDAFNSYLFVDFNAGKIYLKKMNNNGLSDFYVFTLNQEQKNDPFAEINQRLTDEEIMGAKKYLQKYHETSDSIFKEMSNDELKHAEILIKKAYSKLPNNEEK